LDGSIALVEFSKPSRRACVETFEYAHIEVGSKIWFPHRPRHAKLLLDALRAAADRDAVGVLAAAEGLASLRSLAALDASTRAGDGGAKACAKAARRWLAKLATRDVWLAWAARGEPRPAHRRVLRALDATEPSQRAALAGAVAAAPPLLEAWLAVGAKGALTATRPWDAKPGELCAPRALAGCDALGAVLAAGGAGASGAYDRAARPRDVAKTAVARCLPPEDVLSKKDLGRGLMHGDPAANRAALVLVLRVLDRFAAERGAAVDVFGGCAGAAERPPVKAILEVAKRLLEGEDFDLEPHRRREKPGRRVDYECRALLRSRPGQDKRAKFPTSKAPISAVFHSFRLIFGRAIISWNGLEAWMLFPERARAEHSR